MKIAHVVTYVSEDGAFGGPSRVALGQAAELARQGHDVTVYSAGPAGSAETTTQDGYELRLFPARRIAQRLGFAGMYAPGLTRALKRELPRTDVVHIHLARDLVTLPAARAVRRARVPFVVQPHGMIDHSDNPLARPIDAWETAFALRDAAAVLVLTKRENSEIVDLAPTARTQRISNGVDLRPLPEYDGRADRVLFLARMHSRKRPRAFVEAAEILAARGQNATYILAGPDEGEGEAVTRAIAATAQTTPISWIGAVDPAATDALLASARVYVLPSVDEVFPMSVLEAFRAGTPVVTTSSLGIAPLCEEFGAALVTDGTPVSIADAIETILRDDSVAENLRRGAARLLASRLGIGEVVRSLINTYVHAVEKGIEP